MSEKEAGSAADWAHTRRHRYTSSTPPPEWGDGVRGISLAGLNLLGINPRTNELYWDGEKLVTERRLATYERVMLALGVAAAVVTAAVEVASYVWPNAA